MSGFRTTRAAALSSARCELTLDRGAAAGCRDDPQLAPGRPDPVGLLEEGGAGPRLGPLPDRAAGGDVHEIGPGVVYKDANVTVTAFPTKHAMESYGYRFETCGRRRAP